MKKSLRAHLLWAVFKITFIQLIVGFVFFSSATANEANTPFAITISGSVLDEADQPLVGVNVLEKGTTNGTVTDADGKFVLSVADDKAIILFSFIGYATEEIIVGNQTSFKINLTPDIEMLGEVVVTGYGTQKKSDITTSIASVKPEVLTKNATLDMGEMLRGKAAGVMVTTNDAGPGGSSKIIIRGITSVNKDANGNTIAAPLIIADGVAIGSINDINPADIETMDILKDAASQAIYGARAAHGVIMITTKRGKADKVNINYDGYYGTQTAKRNFEVYNGAEWAQLKREAYRATTGNIFSLDTDIFSDSELEAIAEGRSIDWSEEVMQPASIQNHNISVRGGSEKTKVYFGANYQNQTGIVPTTYQEKATIRFNLDQVLTNWLSIGLNNSFQWSIGNDPDVGGIVRQVVTASPLGNIYNPDGTYNVRPGGNQESFNPLLQLTETSNELANRNDIINVFVDISPIKGFNNRINMARRSWNHKGLYYATKLSENGQNSGFANGSIEYKDNAEWTLENITTYTKSFQEHTFNLTVVESAIQANYRQFKNNSSRIPNDLLGIYGLTTAEISSQEVSGNQRRLLSGVARLEYDYMSKYSLSGSIRADGSSVFGANDKWGTFSSVAAGWTISKEDFMANMKHIDFLKLRASYGSVGYQAIEPYNSLAVADQLDYITVVAGNPVRIPGYAPGGTLSNPNLRWETSTSLNIGLNFELLDNRIVGSVEVYDKRTTDMLVKKTLPPIGYNDQPDNIGEVQNKGIEMNLEGTIIRKNDLSVRAGAMFSMNKNQILHLYGDADGDGVEENDAANNWFIGEPIEIFRQPKFIGIWQGTDVYGPDAVFNPTSGKWEVNGVAATVIIDEATGQPLIDPYRTQGTVTQAPIPGTVKVEDRNGDGKIDPDDNYITSRYPKWMGSVNLSANYRGFDFSMDIYTVQGITRTNQFLYDYAAGGDLRANRNGLKVDYWTPENPSNTFPQPNANTTPNGMYLVGLQDASYWRLQNLTIGYRLPASVLSKINFSNARFYVTGQNLITETDYKAYSPEQDLYSYPVTRNYIFGVSFGL